MTPLAERAIFSPREPIMIDPEPFQPDASGDAQMMKRAQPGIQDLIPDTRVLIVDSVFLNERFQNSLQKSITIVTTPSGLLDNDIKNPEDKKEAQDSYCLVVGNIQQGIDLQRASQTLRDLAQPTASIHLNIYHDGDIDPNRVDEAFTEAGIYVQGISERRRGKKQWIEIDGMNDPKIIYGGLSSDRKGI